MDKLIKSVTAWGTQLLTFLTKLGFKVGFNILKYVVSIIVYFILRSKNKSTDPKQRLDIRQIMKLFLESDAEDAVGAVEKMSSEHPANVTETKSTRQAKRGKKSTSKTIDASSSPSYKSKKPLKVVARKLSTKDADLAP